jgi:hypothetical protein
MDELPSESLPGAGVAIDFVSLCMTLSFVAALAVLLGLALRIAYRMGIRRELAVADRSAFPVISRPIGALAVLAIMLLGAAAFLFVAVGWFYAPEALVVD